MDAKDYIKKSHRQRNNKDCYTTLNKDPSTTNAKLMNDKIQRAEKQKEVTQRKKYRWPESV